MSSSNGHHANGASAPESRHDRIVRELREELTDREVVLAALQAQIDAEKSEVVRLRRAARHE
jgi:rubrerythrin